MKKYLDIKTEQDLQRVIDRLELKNDLSDFSAPYEIEDKHRMFVHVNVIDPNGIIFNIEGQYDLVQKLLDKIHKESNGIL